MRNMIAVDRRLGALENQCFMKWVLNMPSTLPDKAKEKARLYHAFAQENKGTGTKVGAALFFVFWALMEEAIIWLGAEGMAEEAKGLFQWFMGIVGDEAGNPVKAKMRNLGPFLSKCEITPTRKVVYVELGFKQQMPPPVVQGLMYVLNKWGRCEHDQRAPVPVMKDVKEALQARGAYGQSSNS